MGFLVRRPSADFIRSHLAAQARLGHCYPEHAATRDARDGRVEVPGHYAVDHHRAQLGNGRPTFERAKAALRRWEMFALPWVELCWPDAPIEIGTTVGILAGRSIWSLNACRIVYTLDEAGDIERYGFGYGTLPDHVEIGEERFLVEYHRLDDSVWYDLLSFSRPGHWVAKLASGYVRSVQHAFARGSMRAMERASSEEGGARRNG
jgi:uncharacterized protein (UPF0548 family)